jgi:hypothetical protein
MGTDDAGAASPFNGGGLLVEADAGRFAANSVSIATSSILITLSNLNSGCWLTFSSNAVLRITQQTSTLLSHLQWSLLGHIVPQCNSYQIDRDHRNACTGSQ